MLDSFRIWPHIRARLQAGPLGTHLDGFVEILQKDGYTPRVIRHHIRAADAFGLWLSSHDLAASQVDEATVSRFVAGLGRHTTRLRPRGRSPQIASGVRKLGAMLWQQGVSRRVEPVAPSATKLWLQAFDEHLEHVRGVTLGTRRIYLRYAGAFVAARFGSSAPDWSQLRADDITEFVRVQAARLKVSACRAPVSATRTVLRFLATTGAVCAGLEGAVPSVREWKLASLPRHLNVEEMARLLESCGEATWIERRNRAILLLLGRLGLRAGEVAALALDDIDWPRGRLLVRAGKSRRERRLPLPHEVGQALAAYLRGGRHHRQHRVIFLSSRPPCGPLRASAVTAIAQCALRRVGIKAPRLGAHVLRHTVATQMVRRGAAFKEVADVLGHVDLQTTAIYAKLDVDTLARVALPWPGGVQ
jgi:site-specific recombinase XerD